MGGGMNAGGMGGGNMGMGGGMPPRQMYDVTAMGLTWATCGTPITQLPFQPTAGKPVYCRDHRPKKSFGMGGGSRGGFGGGFGGGYGGGNGGGYRN